MGDFMEFFNRKKELEDLKKLLSFEPNLIYFIYGPINSGKTTLINEVIKDLDDEYVAFYIDLRAHFISKYDEFIRVLFDASSYDNKNIKKFLKDLLIDVPHSLGGIPIPKTLLNELLNENKSEDVFKYVIDVFENLKNNGKKPILIIDELQVIEDLKINGYLIYKLFNFFISLTKQRHLSHVVVLTSDSLFINKVYNDAMLQLSENLWFSQLSASLRDRCKYYLVDDFDYETTKEFLIKNNFSPEEIETVWNYLGGKPIKLIDVVQEKSLGNDVDEYCKSSLIFRARQIKDELYKLKREDEILFKNVLGLFGKYKHFDSFIYEELTDDIIWAVKKNILFVNIKTGELKPQGKLELLAINEVLKDFMV